MVTGWGSTPTSARIWRPITTRKAGTTLTTTTEVSSPVPWKAARTASVSRVPIPSPARPDFTLLRHAAPSCVRPPLYIWPAAAANSPPPDPAPSPHSNSSIYSTRSSHRSASYGRQHLLVSASDCHAMHREQRHFCR
eukprot:scaffold10787_cov63-Phaeocystis_antarctica.AAC.2